MEKMKLLKIRLSHLYESLSRLGDIKYQKNHWLNPQQENEISTYSDEINWFYSDAFGDEEDFILFCKDIDLPLQCMNIILDLELQIRNYHDYKYRNWFITALDKAGLYNNQKSDKEIIYDYKWQDTAKLAQQCKKTLDCIIKNKDIAQPTKLKDYDIK
jgi:hypothetical protein